ncbi:MAG: hypothetical protein NVSMB47_04070 [Polyangiales bacterium]
MNSRSVRVLRAPRAPRAVDVARLALLALVTSGVVLGGGAGCSCKRATDDKPPSTESPAAMKLRLPEDLALARSTTAEPAPTQGIAIYVSRSKILVGEDAREVATLGDRATLASTGVDAKYKGVDPMLLTSVEEAVGAIRKEKSLGPGVPAVLAIDAGTPFKVVGELVFTVQHAHFERWVLVVRRADGSPGAIVLGTVRPPNDAPPLPPPGGDAALPKSANVSLGVRLGPQGFVLRAFNHQVDCGGPTGLSKSGDGYDLSALTACATREKHRAPDTRDDLVTMTIAPDLEHQLVVSTIDALRQSPDGKPLFPGVGLALVH